MASHYLLLIVALTAGVFAVTAITRRAYSWVVVSLLFVGAYIFLGKVLRDVIYQVLTRSAPWPDLWTATLLAALYAAFAGIVALTLYRAATSDR